MRLRLFSPIYVFLLLLTWSQKSFAQPNTGYVDLSQVDLTIIHGDPSDNFSGSPLVLEFWTSWCEPCLDAVPHLNELALEFPEITFISINSHDSRERAEKIMKKAGIETIVALDVEKNLYNTLGIEVIPTAVLISGNQKVEWMGGPGLLTSTVLKDYIVTGIIDVKPASEFMFSINISEAKDRSTSTVMFSPHEDLGFTFTNKTLKTIIFQVLRFMGVQDWEVQFQGPLPLEPHLDVSFRGNQTIFSSDEIYWVFLEHMAQLNSFTIDTIAEMRTVYYLEQISQVKLNPKSKSNGISIDNLIGELQDNVGIGNVVLGTSVQIDSVHQKDYENIQSLYELNAALKESGIRLSERVEERPIYHVTFH